MKDLDIGFDDLKRLTKWMRESDDIREISLSYNGLDFFISRNENTQRAVTVEAPVATEPSASTASPSPQKNKQEEKKAPEVASAPAGKTVSSVAEISVGDNEHLVTAPMVGTFYEAPKPGAPAFVKVGQKVEPRTIVCIIEVMKLMNNLEAKFNGRVKEIYVEDQQPVEFGQPIMLIEKE
ncbi:acetyl-CoA carboxylase biotin carboxyl carrier protein [Salinicola salarius]|uniref:acetyl-CoA carboxylase biotin carboxyl carrier protein n=1 Tax=Salinicola salarius TaxID=430457 RepID=UPI000B3F94DE|nr:acetyl-CoA carboxylase biotin carboxyl carrier protein [Salinicola salarius]